jgi:hypothetical protein
MKTRCFPRLRSLAAFVAFAVFPGLLSALSVLPTDFNNIVDNSESIFQGEVLSVRSDWTGVDASRHIATYVEFRVVRVFKGDAPNPQTLEFFGGTIGDRTMQIFGLPEFKVGQMELLFVRGNGTDICPLVGIHQGLFHVTKDPASGAERVSMHDGRALADTAQIGKLSEAPAAAAAGTTTGMTVNQFAQRIQARLTEAAAAKASH